MTRVARAGGDREGMAGNGVTFHRGLRLVAGARQVTIDAAHAGLTVNAVRRILRMICVAASAQSIGGRGDAGALSVDFVAVNTGDTHLAMAARRPLLQRVGVAGAAQFF